VCLYKGKGSKGDRAKYCGISLISMVQRFVSGLLSGRIGSHANIHMKHSRAGFRPVKTCRDVIHRLRRDMEKMKDDKIPHIHFCRLFKSL